MKGVINMVRFKQYLSSLFLGISFILFVCPIFVYWFVHGNDDRYIWIISGPFPFSHMGSGPVQVWMFVGLLIFAFICWAISSFLSRTTK
ncbi:hypothetical protein PBAT_07770 [Paenibacillus antarcticus]|uniref:Uncharacterized protein n=1 Tax=Paenibacillus antarcticus TaxID=253703 RepID=A0A168PXJ4_9BACL|nr:hypothetical protein PBAT_07770 [Paenibacillus antarcticus]